MADEKYPKRTYGTYEYDKNKSIDENIAAAKAANALVLKADFDRYEKWLALLDEREMTPGPAGKDGAPGKDGAKGEPGKDGTNGTAGKAGTAGVGIKSLTLTVDADGKVTGGTMTKTDNSTAAITVTTA